MKKYFQELLASLNRLAEAINNRGVYEQIYFEAVRDQITGRLTILEAELAEHKAKPRHSRGKKAEPSAE